MGESYLLTDLPNEILENILSYLSYDEIAKNRVICRKFDTTCRILLNVGFLNVERRHSALLKKVKSQLPRRESERRIHPLARHSDILVAIGTRINMLRITFMKYIDKDLCCFYPGKVIDEILRILKMIDNIDNPPRSHEVLLELRDISSMALEHFDEKIAPNLKIPSNIPMCSDLPGPSLLNMPIPDIFINNTFRRDFNIIQQQTIAQKKQISILKDIVSKLCSRVKKQSSIMHIQHNKLREQSAKLKEQDASIAELKRHVEEWDTKFQDFVQNLNRSKDDTVSLPDSPDANLNKTSTIATVGSAATPIMYKPNIKPRIAQILPKSLNKYDLPLYEYERKRKLPISSSISSIPSKVSRLQFLNNEDSDCSKSSNYYHRYSDSPLLKLPSFLSSGLETFLKSPISSIRSRKRKLQ